MFRQCSERRMPIERVFETFFSDVDHQSPAYKYYPVPFESVLSLQRLAATPTGIPKPASHRKGTGCRKRFKEPSSTNTASPHGSMNRPLLCDRNGCRGFSKSERKTNLGTFKSDTHAPTRPRSLGAPTQHRRHAWLPLVGLSHSTRAAPISRHARLPVAQFRVC